MTDNNEPIKMPHPEPNKITLERHTDDERLVDITFHNPAYPDSKATYPRGEIIAWVDRWFYKSNRSF